MVGAMEALGSLIYKINSKDAAEIYMKTTEAILVDHVKEINYNLCRIMSYLVWTMEIQ
jgi:hypothetical protein